MNTTKAAITSLVVAADSASNHIVVRGYRKYLTNNSSPLTLPQYNDLRKAHTEWLSKLADWSHALTINFKRHDACGKATGRLECDRAINHFLHVLSHRAAHRLSATRKKFRIPAIAIVGWGIYDAHPHAHLALAIPEGINAEEFARAIEVAASKTQLLQPDRCLEKYDDEGWIGYILDHGFDELHLESLPTSSDSRG
jgi:hypothetical protein